MRLPERSLVELGDGVSAPTGEAVEPFGGADADLELVCEAGAFDFEQVFRLVLLEQLTVHSALPLGGQAGRRLALGSREELCLLSDRHVLCEIPAEAPTSFLRLGRREPE